MKIFWNPPGRTFTFHFIHVTLVCMYITSVNSNASSIPSCTKYGSSPCLFVPAAPGQTPPCARPGSTYCERIDGYPTLLIKQLVRQWGYEARNLLIDETWDDFNAITWNNQASFYDPANTFTHTAQNNERTFHGYKYARPTDAFYDNHRNYDHNPYLSAKTAPMEDTARKLNVNRNNNIYVTSVANDAKDRTSYSRALWLKRIVRDLSETRTMPETNRHKQKSLIIDMSDDGGDPDDTGQLKLSKRDVSMNKNFLQIMNIQPNTVKGRRKRQSPGRVTLCQSTTQYITPQAALNSKGNWMFVVNEDETARQMVKTEVCASNVCSHLCQLPNGYNSRCEQKFVQKRLIALQGNGQNLYTDTFWFPSCCVCTISSN